jgi:hypothetical protein
MKVQSNPISVQYYLDYQRYLDRLSDTRRVENLRAAELIKQKTHIERIIRARELDKNLGQNIDTYA